MKKTFSKFLNKWTPLVPGFRSTTIFRAFVLNAVSGALIATIAIFTKSALDNSKVFENSKDNQSLKAFLTFLAALISAFVTYCILYILFHFGGGMIAN